MLGKRSSQSKLFSADAQYLEFVGEDTFYGFLARHGRHLFADEDFRSIYCADNGRRSVPPSLLALALLLQTHDRVSDQEAKHRADYDLRWKVALGVEIEERPFAKSTLQEFRAQLVIHEQVRTIFVGGLEHIKGLGYLRKTKRVRAALDTAAVLGRGAVLDTYNLIAEGIRRLARVLAQLEAERLEQWLGTHKLARYAEPSIKGTAEVDWEDAGSREAFLSGLIEDGQRTLDLARQVRGNLAPGSEADGQIAEAAQLLERLLWQDVEPGEHGHRIAQGTTRDRIPSATDPEQRHGHKSQGKSFTGHKAAVVVDADSQLITAVEILPGNAGDGEWARHLVEQAEAHTGLEVEQVIGDTAFGSMQVRQELGEREVIAPTVKAHRRGRITKEDFEIDMEAGLVRCPEGHTTREWRWATVSGPKGSKVRTKRFAFPQEVCRGCARYGQCVGDKRRRGRYVTLHPREQEMQQARALEQTDYFRQQYRKRVVVEHRIGRLVQLGMRQARYLGRAKTLLQLVLAATVANLTLVAGRLVTRGCEDGPPLAKEEVFTGFWGGSVRCYGADVPRAIILALLPLFGASNPRIPARLLGPCLSPGRSVAPL